jgi:L-fuculose-phosphate aldolase
LKKAPLYTSVREKVLETFVKMAEAGLVVAKEGNVSARIPGEEKIAITPSQIPYDMMKADDILVVGFDETIFLGKLKPSTETKMHIAVYKARGDVGGVIHTHSPYASALSCIGGKIPALLDEQTVFLGGDIGTAPYALAGSAEIAANAAQALSERDGTMLSNHGTICCGKDLDDALRNATLVEKLAMIYITAKNMGEIVPIPADIAEFEHQYYKALRKPLSHH